MAEHMARLAAKHICVRETRNIGLFGCIELQKDAEGTPLVPYAGSHPAMATLSSFLRNNGLFTLTAQSLLMCNPPLCITREQLGAAFDVIDKGLSLVDAVVTSGGPKR